MITPYLAWEIRVEFGGLLNPAADYSHPRLKQIAERMDALNKEWDALDAELKSMAAGNPPDAAAANIATAARGDLRLTPSTAVEEGKALLLGIRNGHSPSTSNLEALDEVLSALTQEEEQTVRVVSSKGPMSIEMAKRLRFVRGLDIRPKTLSCAGDGEQPA